MIFKRFVEDFKTIEDVSDIYYDCGEETRFYLFDEALKGDVGISCSATLENVHINGTLRVNGSVFLKRNSSAVKIEADELIQI